MAGKNTPFTGSLSGDREKWANRLRGGMQTPGNGTHGSYHSPQYPKYASTQPPLSMESWSRLVGGGRQGLMILVVVRRCLRKTACLSALRRRKQRQCSMGLAFLSEKQRFAQGMARLGGKYTGWRPK